MRTPKGRSKRGVEQRLGSSMRGFRVGLDIGGTFTDFVLLNDATGELRLHKVLTTTPDPAEVALRVLTPLDRGQVGAAARRLAAQGVESLAVSLLHAYKNPAHEQAALAAVRDAVPELSVSLSSDVVPEIREWERTCTTVCNAYVQPL